MDEGKVAAEQNWPTPATIKELQRFLEFTNFYRHFIKNLSAITSPSNSLLKNRPKILSWNSTAAQAMNTFKNVFTALCSSQS